MKAKALVECDGWGIIRSDFKKSSVSTTGQPFVQQTPPDALILMCRVNGDRQQFRLARNEPRQGKAAGVVKRCDKRRGKKISNLGGIPTAITQKGGRVDFCHLIWGHGKMAGGASRAGAASAGRKYSGAGRGLSRDARLAAICAMASASGIRGSQTVPLHRAAIISA
ncbi:MAG: hypothetical protein ACI83E_000668 [Sulfitobacter sp.]|jgi:hypothetical protein